jgi:hypothetical protein
MMRRQEHNRDRVVDELHARGRPQVPFIKLMALPKSSRWESMVCGFPALVLQTTAWELGWSCHPSKLSSMWWSLWLMASSL